jgi:hypothetical protein
MRLRFVVLATALVALIPAATPAVAGAASHHHRGLTIRAVPRNVIAGETVLVFGQLLGPNHSNQVLRLYHRLHPNSFFTHVATTRTNSRGQYEFIRPSGVVERNVSWFVRGPAATHSRTVTEQVAALVTMAASSPSGLTLHPVTFSGHVIPNHAGEIVRLQSQRADGRWTTIGRGLVGPDSNYQIPYSFRFAGAYSIRVMFPGDARNTAAPSDVSPVVIQQTEVPDFTIQTSDPIVPSQSAFTITGTLERPGATTPQANTMVTLFAREPQGGSYHVLTSTVTGSNGNYTFANLESATNQLYQVRATFAPARHSANLFEGVQDVVTIRVSSPTSTVGGQVTLTGDVSPNKTGHVIYLQKMGADGFWHTVKASQVNPGSTFQFPWTFGASGVKQFRVRITGGPANVGGASAPATIDVMQPPLTSLPTRSANR